MSGGYRALLRQPGAARLAAAGLISRLPLGMLGLTCVLVLLKATGSYAAGGLAAGLYLLATAIAGPICSRLADRAGPRLVLVATGCGQAAALVAFAATAEHSHSTPALLTLAAASGTLAPPMGALMRTLWSSILAHDSAAKAAAFAYESLMLDLGFIVGPAAVTAIATLTRPSAALLVAAAATAAGGLLTATSPHTRPGSRRTVTSAPRPSPLRHPAVLAVLPVGFLLTSSVTLTQTTLVAAASAAGHRDAAGILVAALSAGSIVGGLYFGNRKPTTPATRRLPRLLALLGAGWATLTLLDNLWLVGAALALVGLALNPTVTAVFAALDETAARDSLTESFAWLATSTAAGLATGAALAGLAASATASYGFLLAAASCLLACGLARACSPLWQRRTAATATE